MKTITNETNNNNGTVLDTYLNNNSENRSMSFSKKVLIGLGLIVTSFTALSDQVIFSQYDGVNTWNNTYVEVDNALDFVKPGVGFAPAFAGSESAGTQAVAGVQAVAFSPRVITAVTRVSKVVATQVSGDQYNYTTTIFGTSGVGTTTSAPWTFDQSYIDSYKSLVNMIGGTYTDVLGTEEVEGVAEVKEVKPSWEQSLPARAIVAVDTDVDMEAFIKDFFK